MRIYSAATDRFSRHRQVFAEITTANYSAIQFTFYLSSTESENNISELTFWRDVQCEAEPSTILVFIVKKCKDLVECFIMIFSSES